MAKLSDVVVLEIALFYPRFNTNDVDMKIVWKDTMFEDISYDAVKNNTEKNEEILKVMEKKIGTFPKSVYSGKRSDRYPQA